VVSEVSWKILIEVGWVVFSGLFGRFKHKVLFKFLLSKLKKIVAP